MNIDIPLVTVAILLMVFFLSTIYGIPILIIMHTKMKRHRELNNYDNSYCSIEEGRTITVDSMKYTALETEFNQVTCLICLQDFAEDELVIKMKCKHIFHSNCMEKWIQVKLKCPICSEECQ